MPGIKKLLPGFGNRECKIKSEAERRTLQIFGEIIVIIYTCEKNISCR